MITTLLNADQPVNAEQIGMRQRVKICLQTCLKIYHHKGFKAIAIITLFGIALYLHGDKLTFGLVLGRIIDFIAEQITERGVID